MTIPPGEPTAYERGVKAGRIDEELANHGRRLDKINGSMEKVAERLGSIDSLFSSVHLDLQKIQNQMAADIVTRVATAQALKEAAEAQRQAAEKRWSPIQKWFAVIGALGVLIAIVTQLI